MKRSRFTQCGFAGLCFRCRVQSATAISAIPIGMPGWPLFAASTASIARARIAFASRESETGAGAVGAVIGTSTDCRAMGSGGARRFGKLRSDSCGRAGDFVRAELEIIVPGVTLCNNGIFTVPRMKAMSGREGAFRLAATTTIGGDGKALFVKRNPAHRPLDFEFGGAKGTTNGRNPSVRRMVWV